MKKLLSLLFVLITSISVYAQTSTLPSSLGDFKLFRNAKAPFTMVTDPGFEKDTVIIELWNDDIKLSDSTAVTLSGDTIKFTLTKQQIAPLTRNAKMFIRFSADSTISPELGANVTTSFGIGIPNIASRNIQLPGRGVFRVSVVGDASEAIQAAAKAKAYRDSAKTIYDGTSSQVLNRLKKGSLAQFKADSELFDSYELLYGNRSGMFVYDASDTTTPEDTALVITKGPRRYKRQFQGAVNALWWGIVGDGTTEMTTRIQKMVDNPKVVTMYFPKTSSPYRLDYISVPSNKHFVFEDGTEFLGLGLLGKRGGDSFRIRMWRIFDVENVSFRGKASFRDIKSAYAGPTWGEQRHIFLIQGSKNVTLEGITAGSSGGDGFYVGGSPTNLYAENILLRDCIADDNKRQGMSVISAVNLLVDNCVFQNTAGIAPGAGIDLEPNAITDRYQNVRFINCKLVNNEGDGMLILFSNNTNSTYPVDIVIENMISVGSEAGLQFANCRGELGGEIVVKNFISQNPLSNGIRVRNWSANGPRITIQNPTITSANATNKFADTGYGAAIYILRESSDISDTLVGNAHFYNPKIEDKAGFTKAGFSMSSTTIPIVNCSLINPMSFKGIPAAQQIRLYTGGIVIRDDYNVLTEQITAALPGGAVLGTTAYKHLYHNAGQASERQAVLGNMGKYWTAELVFEVRAAQYLRIKPNAANAIFPLSTVAGKYIRSNVIGSRIVLNWDVANAGWVVKSIVGTWEVEP
ncbi:right-handed parallel beta-helix repeat-containing protein [Pedobacter sp.]|uniref:right-handed parallel beta-helix repeat-containing protein n=1 Tax=Pedobacter sp. TaxID=1411316 RepID=UPI003C5C8F40